MTLKKLNLLLIFFSLIILVLTQEKSTTKENAMVTLKLIGQNGSVIETKIVDKNSEKIAITKKKLVKIEGLENLPHLTEINITHCLISSLEWIPKGIKKLTLYFNQLKELENIEKYISLQEIYLDGNKINDIKGIFKLTLIKTLTLTGNKIEILDCSENESIEEIFIESNKIAIINSLNKLKKLKRLSLAGNPIELDKNQIAKLRKENPGVEIMVRDKIKEK